jgi:hypothetical protein
MEPVAFICSFMRWTACSGEMVSTEIHEHKLNGCLQHCLWPFVGHCDFGNPIICTGHHELSSDRIHPAQCLPNNFVSTNPQNCRFNWKARYKLTSRASTSYCPPHIGRRPVRKVSIRILHVRLFLPLICCLGASPSSPRGRQPGRGLQSHSLGGPVGVPAAVQRPDGGGPLPAQAGAGEGLRGGGPHTAHH